MARIIEERRTCDYPDHKGRPAIITFAITIDEGDEAQHRPRPVDLCAECAELMRDLRDFVHAVPVVTAERPTPPRALPAKGVRVRCPVCNGGYSRANIIAHVTRQHGVSIRQPQDCPTCGAHYERAPSMGLHRASIHGFDLMAELAEAARNHRPPSSLDTAHRPGADGDHGTGPGRIGGRPERTGDGGGGSRVTPSPSLRQPFRGAP